MSNGIYVSGPQKDDILQLRVAILAILEARADQETIRKALDTLAQGVTTNTSISGCSIVMKNE